MIDTGIDWAHPDFRGTDDPTRSRVRALWDQTLSPTAGETSPAGFGYGVEYTRRDIEDEIDGTPARRVRSTDTNGHGTHLAGTVAGNGAASTGGTKRGMAPEADIVAVKTDFSGVGIADGLAYCGAVSEEANRPVVVTLGLGTMAGPHDGSSALARAIDDFVGPGRSVVVAAGNGGDTRRHVAKTLPAERADSLRVQVARYAPNAGAENDVAFHLDTWISGSRPGSMALVTPTGVTVPLAADTAAAVQTGDGTVVYERTERPGGDRHVEVIVHDAEAHRPPASGTWRVVVNNAGSSSTTVHSWLVETTTASILKGGDRRTTITTPATARRALAVGAWAHRPAGRTGTSAGPVASFSGQGPLRGRGRKPDLVAPGGGTVSARARAASMSPSRTRRNGRYALRRGTSTAAAATAGGVALLFQHEPSLSGKRAAALLRRTAQSRSEGEWSPGGGHGALDLYRAMAALQGRAVATRDRLAYDDSGGEGQRTSYPLGGPDAGAMAVRVTPPRSGAVQALYLRTASGTAAPLRDSVAVSIWTDDDGRPGRRLGSTVQVAPGAFADRTMNVVSIVETGVVVEQGTDYHVVVEARGEGTLHVSGEQRAVDGRSSIRRRRGWVSLTNADLGIQVSTAFALDLGTPRPTAPAPGALLTADEPVTLTWAPVANAERYTIQVAPSERFRPERTDTLRSRSSSRSLSGLAPSTAHHWRVRAERKEYTGAWSRPRSFVLYPTTIDVSVSRSFEAEGHRLVALPGRQAIPLVRTVEGRAGNEWQAFRDRGRSETSFVAFDGSDRFHFRPGTGFWLRSDRPWTVRTTVPTVALSDEGTYAIDLHDGWNIISNPFELDVPWGAVRAANDGSLPPLWRYDGRFEAVSTFASARTGEAFYLLNDRGRETLRLPYPAGSDGAAGTAAKSGGPAALTLAAYRDDRRAAQVKVGVHENATDGRDRYDRVAPPARFARTSLRLEGGGGADLPSRQRRLAAEYRSATAEGHTFALTLRAQPGTPVTLRADGVDAFEGKQVVLIDPATATSYDLRTTSTITLRPDEESRSLRLLVGSSDYVAAKKEVTLPDDLRFFPNYPNPFSDQTTLEYVLPDPGTVRLAVYDVLGRQVRVLVDENQQAGRHTVQWDGRDESGRRLASGVYLARLMVGGTTKVRKMTFVR
jgi:hypothetical protein